MLNTKAQDCCDSGCRERQSSVGWQTIQKFHQRVGDTKWCGVLPVGGYCATCQLSCRSTPTYVSSLSFPVVSAHAVLRWGVQQLNANTNPCMKISLDLSGTRSVVAS